MKDWSSRDYIELEIVILRHGEAGKRVPASSRDAERALTVSGRQEVEEVSKSLEELKMEFDVIATSPLKRAYETAQIVAKRLGKEKSVEVWDELKPEEDFESLYRRLGKLKQESSVMLVGHEPYLSSMIANLIGAKGSPKISLKKAGVAKLEVSMLTPTPSGELRWLLTPRVLKKVT